jgi:hypothetical protein
MKRLTTKQLCDMQRRLQWDGVCLDAFVFIGEGPWFEIEWEFTTTEEK